MVSKRRGLFAAVLSLLVPFLIATPVKAAPADSLIAQWGTDTVNPGEQYYFVLPDRFANGSTANDKGGLTGDRLKTGLDTTDKGFYHGGDLAGVIDKLDYIQGLGTTAIWLAPVFKNRPVQGSGTDISAGYHGYWITDFTQVDPHFGTNEELRKLVRLAHQRGLKVYLDIITNHTADVIKYAEEKYDYIDKTTSPYEDSKGRAFEDRNYADSQNGFPRVSTESFPYTPVVAQADRNVKVPAWLNDPTMYHNRGNSTFAGENSEYGDFFGLDDLWTERPDVVRGLTDIYAHWIGYAGIDGYRLDTVKHVNLDFWPQFAAGIKKAAGKKDFFMFGEVYSADQEIESAYVRQGGLPATLDFSFQAAAQGFVAGNGSAKALSELYAKDDLYTARDTSAASLPTFLGNHDMGRIGSFIAATGADDAAKLRRDQLAHELMFLTRGQPVVYSGDEQGFTGPGGDKDARQDLFASKTADYLDDDLIGTDRTHAVDNYNTAHPLYKTIAAVGALRKAHPALRDGVQVTRYAADGPGVFAASRVDPRQRNEYVIASNSATTPQTVTLDTWSAGKAFRGIYGTNTVTAAGDDGKLTITVPALSSVALRADKPIAVPSAAPSVSLNTPELVPARAELTATVTGDPLSTVTFAAQVGDGPWKPVGTATRAPYTVFHDLTGLAGGTPVKYKAVVRDGKGRLASATSGIKVGTPEVATSPDYAIVHYQRPAGGYDDQGLYVFGDVDPSMTTTWPAGQPFAGEDSYGRFAYVKLTPNAKNMGFIVVGKDGVKDVDADRFLDPSATPEVWLKQGDATVYPSRQAATGQPDPVQDQSTAIIHYRRADGNYDGWGLHVWDGAASPTDWAAPLQPAGTDAFGVYFRVPLAAGASALNYIIHKGDTKDLPDDQKLTFADGGHEIWLLGGVSPRIVPVVKKVGAGGVVDLSRSSAVWIDRTTVAWPPGGDTDGKVYDLVEQISNTSIRLSVRRDGLTEAQRTKFPHLWQYSAFRLPAGVDVKALLRGQVTITERDATGKLLAATGVQTAGVLDDVYAAAASASLGPVGTTLSVWAPTAQKVDLLLYDTATAVPSTVAMRRDDRTGVWSVRGPSSWRGKYYKYSVTAWQPAAQKVVTAAVTDPYSLALSTDSTLSRIVDLADPALAPAGWKSLRKPAATPSAKIQIAELSVRDFSMADATVPEASRGTYKAFTSPSTAGMKQLSSLSRAGVTHLHLLPVFDFATIPENRADQKQPDCDLAALPPDSDQQQACIAAVAATDGYNWGYDPLHYTVPEGGYAVDPAQRTREFREMVGGVNKAGLRVVMDVVYNHTSAAGTDPHSVLDQIVPGYYQRLLADGTVANSTCCANTAPENTMMGKLVVDSVVTWAKAYKVDGFRFDLMGHHPKANILAVRAALDKLTVAKDGVDGKNIYVYGEGWDFGEVAGGARFEQATQATMAGTGIGTFNDRLRDAVRGGGPFDANPRVQGFGSGLLSAPNGDAVNADAATRLPHYQDLIKVGLSGNLASYRFVASTGSTVTGAQVDYNGSPAGYTAAPGEAITYVDAHDNEVLYDALAYKLPSSTSAVDRARLQSVALSTTALGQGVGFFALGSERLRSKSLDRNSFNSGDWFNQIIWDCAQGNGFGRGLPPAADNQDKWPYAKPLLASSALVPSCDAIHLADARYKELLAIRGSTPVFGLPTAAEVQKRLSFPLSGAGETPGVITMTLDGRGLDPRWKSVTVVFNGTSAATTQTVPALKGKTVALHPVQRSSADPLVRTAAFVSSTGTFTVPARTTAVFVQSR
ncbi:pullulanase-type alpha-1,6-glucosidase [Paractinoplanes atraurantiacus]|uniref:1,4-alpha-D-glucan glucanohydrolase n=1 Tax=Paractinoplanes atraurantiacus TaxID=1036182 RepID=A0A285KTB6_9ACTN|nr:pullulanase-type alpha-1,6-glucosidase [Actinoplanes atraurantiacus]SNY75097.1 alpha-1,6-glucosidases, pullulanase-type [Actinoplanes atraurantiacus]